jgi:hypothetical protein
VEVAVVCSAVGNILWELVAAAEQSLYGRSQHQESVQEMAKRKPAEPKEGFILRTKQQPVHLGAKKFVFSEVYNF